MGREAIHPPSETSGEDERKRVKRDAWSLLPLLPHHLLPLNIPDWLYTRMFRESPGEQQNVMDPNMMPQ